MQQVDLLGWTTFDHARAKELTGWTCDDPNAGGAALAEFAGRLCYLSWNKPNPETATLWGYIKNILKQRHFSVLEHGTATFLFQGISRSCSHQLIRHRHFSYSEVSQRFVNVEENALVIPPALVDEDTGILEYARDHARQAYAMLVERLTDDGVKRKQAREAARVVMPEGLETKIVVTGNYRAWRHFLKVRGSIHADAEIRELAVKVATMLISHAPAVFQDVNIDLVDGFECVSVGQSEDS